MKLRIEKLIIAIILSVLAVITPIIVIIVALDNPESLGLFEAIIMAIILFLLFGGIGILNYIVYKKDKSFEEELEDHIIALEKKMHLLEEENQNQENKKG